jgi:uncharacterized Zn finger protein (UPF0148 family)
MALPNMAEEIECPRCGANLERKNYEDEKLVIEPEEATLTEIEAEKKWERHHQQDQSVEPKLAEKGAARQRCERCGAMVITNGRRFCALCGARLAIEQKAVMTEEKIIELKEATLTEIEAEKRWERDHQQEESVEPELVEQETARQRCERCGAMVITTGRRFCALCGAPLAVEPEAVMSEEKTYAPQVIPMVPEEAMRGPKCMVCELPLKRKDSKLYCPYCGNAAHRDHFLEWLHVKKVCPICGEHVQESEARRTIRKISREL